MPNKYSHAIVVSNYESYGLIDFDRPRSSKSVSSSKTTKSHIGSSKPKPQNSQSTHQSSHYRPKENLSRRSSHRSDAKSNPPLHRRTSSIETQIYAPLHSPVPPSTRSCDSTPSFESHNHTSDEHTTIVNALGHNCTTPSKSQYHTPHVGDAAQGSKGSFITQEITEMVSCMLQEHISQPSSAPESEENLYNRSLTELQVEASSHPLPIEQNTNLRHSLAVAIGGSSYASPNHGQAPAISAGNHMHSLKRHRPPLQISYDRRVQCAAQAFAPERPPSPPATPDSAKSFSLETPIEKPAPISSPPPVPERSALRQLSGPPSKSNSLTQSTFSMHTEPSKPNTSTFSPTGTPRSMTTVASSVKSAPGPPLSLQLSNMPSEPFFDDDADLEPLPRASSTMSQPFEVDDADLESLPSTYVPSSPDFNVQPWSDENAGPAIFRHGELNCDVSYRRPSTAGPLSTRASSFDSAAPPPIGMNRRTPLVLTDMTQTITPRAPTSHRKSKPSLASLAFFRSAPKAVLYSQTIPGTPPVPVSISRTAAPSIPTLFPNYKGSFPPSVRNNEQNIRASRDSCRGKQVRGRSVPPKSSDRRRSWFKADSVEREFGFTGQGSRRGSEQRMGSTESLGLR